MDPSQDQGAPEQRRPDRRRQRDRSQPQPQLHISQQRPIALAHPVIAGYNGSPSARNALAYAAGMARRLDRPLLIVYVTSPGVYCEPMTGQVVGLLRDADALVIGGPAHFWHRLMGSVPSWLARHARCPVIVVP